MTVSRVYLSNIAKAWPFDRQEKLCAEKVPGWPGVTIYRDEVKPRERKAHVVAALVQRGFLLRATGRRGGETIYVPTLALLAWELRDFERCLEAAEVRNATVVALDSGSALPPHASRAEWGRFCDEFLSRRRSVQTEGTIGAEGGKIAGQRRAEAAEKRCQVIAARWPLPSDQYPTADLLTEAKVSRNTAKKYLGDREKAQRAHQASLRQGAINRKRRKTAA